jgi:hypothetical protein
VPVVATRIERRRLADQLTDRALFDVGSELRDDRLSSGLSLASIGAVSDMSRWEVARYERAELPDASFRAHNRLAAANGVRLSLKLYPLMDPVRDVAHARLLDRLRDRVGTSLRWRPEVPLPGSTLRAWDAMVVGHRERTAVEAETAIRDGQAMERRIELKRRDDPSVDRVVLLVADTRRNRDARASARRPP